MAFGAVGSSRRDQPLITPTGRKRATFLEIPTLSTTSTYVIDILVRSRLFLSQAFVASGAGDDADLVELVVDAPAGGELDRSGAAHHSAGAMAARAERVLHAAGLAGEHPTGRSHAAGDDNRLADRAINGRDVEMTWRKRPRRSLAVNAHLLEAAATYIVILELGDVVCDVVDHVHPEPLPGLLPKNLAKTSRAWWARSLAIAPARIVGGGQRMGAQIRLALRAARTGAQASCQSGSSKPYFAWERS